MTDFNAKKKAEHEKLAEAAANAGNWDDAATNLALAAKFTLALAEQCEGAVAEAHFDDAKRLAEFAVKLREKAEETSVAASATGEADADEGGDDKWKITKPDEVHLDDVVGLEEAKEVVLNTLIDPKRDPDVFEKLKLNPCKGLLLYGPPGTGKTTFAKAVATELGLPFMEIQCADLKDKYVGASEKNVRDAFDAARKHGKCVLFFDECDRVMSQRGNEKISMVEEFLVQFNKNFSDESTGLQIFVLAATNKPWTIDERLLRPGRLNPSAYVEMPGVEARKQMFKKVLADIPLAEDVSFDELAKMTDGYGGADICASGGVCYKAKIYAARRWLSRRRAGGNPAGAEAVSVENVTMSDFVRSVGEVVPAVKYAAGVIGRLEEYRAQMTGNVSKED